MDIDRDGIAWVALASGHLASFDRRTVKGPLNGPKATGQHAREGWTFYAEPLPQLQGVTAPGSAEASYYTWVDQFNTLGLGRNVLINTGNESEGLLVLKDGRWVILRVPYPLGFYTKSMEGRIDNPESRWKGRGLWTCISTRAPFHMEGGKGTTKQSHAFSASSRSIGEVSKCSSDSAPTPPRQPAANPPRVRAIAATASANLVRRGQLVLRRS